MSPLQTARVTSAARRAAMPPPVPVARRKPGRPRSIPAPTDAGTDELIQDIEAATPLKARTLRLIEGVRAPFKAHVTIFGHMDEKAADLAPEFMKAFRTWEAETSGSFVTFVRLFDDTVPANRDPDPKDRENQGYRNHRSYRAADYLRRLVPGEEGEEKKPDRDAPLPVSEAFVRLLAAIVALIPGNQVEKLWEILGTELHWSKTKVDGLRTQVEEVEPLMEATAERGHLTVVH